MKDKVIVIILITGYALTGLCGCRLICRRHRPVDLKRMLASDAAVSQVEIEYAQQRMDVHALLLVWLLSDKPENRKNILQFLLEIKQTTPDEFKGYLESIDLEMDVRLKEIHEIDTDLQKADLMDVIQND